MLFYGSFFLLALSLVCYHLFLKVTPTAAHPLLALAVTYVTAAVICLVLLAVYPLTTSLGESFRQLNWVSVALAFAAVGIEVGFLLVYWAGADISLAGLVTNIIVALLLLPLGVLLFKEQLSRMQLVGMGVCIVGLILLNQRH